MHRLRREIPPSASLGDVSAYYRKVAVGWDGYWLHGDIPVGDFLNAIEKVFCLALSSLTTEAVLWSGDADFTRPLRELTSNFRIRRRKDFDERVNFDNTNF